jgi:prevent-host-death family protein
MTMALHLRLDTLEDLPRTPASDVKKLGWRGVMKALGRRGKLVVTNHNEPEAVILPIAEYDAILRALQAAAAHEASVLDTLRLRFDERLVALQSGAADEPARALLRKPARLDGKLKAGDASR